MVQRRYRPYFQQLNLFQIDIRRSTSLWNVDTENRKLSLLFYGICSVTVCLRPGRKGCCRIHSGRGDYICSHIAIMSRWYFSTARIMYCNDVYMVSKCFIVWKELQILLYNIFIFVVLTNKQNLTHTHNSMSPTSMRVQI